MDERRADIGQRAVIGAVIRRLYFGTPTRQNIEMNARILKDLNRRGYDWPTLLRVVEGLAIRRDSGELKGVNRDAPVSLRWVIHRGQLNQIPVCLDAAFRDTPKAEPKRGGVTTMADILSHWSKSA